MDLPAAIQIRLVSDAVGIAELSEVLVALDVLHQGRYYFGAVLGLTDTAGRLHIERSDIEQSFTENQRLFPMDYRVSLAQCDAQIAVRVLGGLDFAEAQTAAEENAFMPAEVRDLWRRARNRRLANTQVQLDLREQPPDVASVVLPVSPLGGLLRPA
jgi:hypothetical protein